MSATLQKRAPGVITSTACQTRELNAETVTAIATGFLRRIENKGSLKAKRTSLGESTYTVEVEMKKLMAIVQIDAKTHKIRSCEIQPSGEEPSSSSFSPKIIIMKFGVSAVVYVGLYSAFKMFGL